MGADEEARRALVQASWGSIVGSAVAVGIYAWRGVPWWSWLAVGTLSAACVVAGLVVRRAPRLVWLAVFSVESAAVLAAFWFSGEALAASGGVFSPFNGNKLFTLLVATFCPSVWLGGTLIAAAAVEALVQAAHWGAGMAMPQLEPAQTIGIAIGAFVFLERRRRRAALSARLRQVEAERRWLERVARFALLVRDLIQDALKAVRGGVTEVRLRQAARDTLMARMERSLARLERLNETLAPLDLVRRTKPFEQPPPEQEPADASLAVIERLQQDLRASRPSAPDASARTFEAPPPRDARDEARNAALAAGAITFIGGVSFLWFLRNQGYPLLPAVFFVVGGLPAAALALVATRLGARSFQALFAATIGAAVAGILVNNDAMASRGHFDAFPGIKLAVLVIAFLAPAGRLGAALIVLAALGPVAETYLWWSPEQRGRMPLLEPWPTVLVGVAAVVVLAGQRRRAALAHQLAQAQAGRAWAARMAELALSVRDFANTPIQTLTITISLARRGQGDPALDGVQAAVERLAHLTSALAPLAALVERDPRALSFDALDGIADEVRHSLSGAALASPSG
jgi:hypothetical protein